MVLDSNKQRDLLLQIIKSMQFSGNIEELSKAIEDIRGLIKAIEEAEIKDESNTNKK